MTSILELSYRTKTYIAGDWTGDHDLIQQLYDWSENKRLILSFHDIHQFTQSRDNSLNCSIKRSLRLRMNKSKYFILVVGKNTKKLTAGACRYCPFYRPINHFMLSLSLDSKLEPTCTHNMPIDNKSYIEYECEMAYRDFKKGLIKKIIVIYNGLTVVNKLRCPDVLKYVGIHIPSDVRNSRGELCWNYSAIRDAIIK